jgi:DNA-binding NarL/FixJ family response regulator
MNSPVTVIMIDDHPIVRAGMRSVLELDDGIHVLAEGGSAVEALELVAEHQPDVLVLDINLPDQSGLEVVRQLQNRTTSTAVLALTAHDDPEMIFGLLESGATGYVLKDEALETLANAVSATAQGESWLSPSVASQVVRRAVAKKSPQPEAPTAEGETLTPREMEVLCLLAQGLDNTAIANQLSITKRTVQNHVSNIYGKLMVSSRTEAMLYAIKRGWVKPSSGGP